MAENKTNESTEMTVNGGFSELSNMNFLVEAMNDECAGLEFSLDRVKIPSGGMTAFEVPTGDGESSELQKEIECVILLSHPANAYYRDVYKGGSNPPDCGSLPLQSVRQRRRKGESMQEPPDALYSAGA